MLCDGGRLSVPASLYLHLLSIKGTIRKQGPFLHHSAGHITCFGKNSKDVFVCSFWKVCFYSIGD